MGVDDGLASFLAHEVELRTAGDVRLGVLARVLRTVGPAVCSVHVIVAAGSQRVRVGELVHVTLGIRQHTRREASCGYAGAGDL